MSVSVIRIGTRGSPLALAQAGEARDRLLAAHGLAEAQVEIVVIKTSGDRIQDRPLSEVGGKGLFTKEIEAALLAGSIDCAVHSMKDVETHLPEGLSIACLLPRQDVRDAFISLRWATLAALPVGARLGTSSLRRQAQVRRLRPDLAVGTLRGNVGTRLRKLDEGAVEATLLAVAGLNRLGLSRHITAVMATDVMLPAVAQGAIGIEIRSGDERMPRLLAPIDDPATATAIACERAFLAGLDGSCKTPIAGLAEVGGGRIRFRGLILSPDGAESHATAREGTETDAMRLGADAATELLSRAGPRFLGR